MSFKIIKIKQVKSFLYSNWYFKQDGKFEEIFDRFLFKQSLDKTFKLLF
jgi:hypothetical protein